MFVVIASPYIVPAESVLLNTAPTIGVPLSVPSSVTRRVKVPVAAIVKLYVLFPSAILTDLGSIVELSYPFTSAVALYVPFTTLDVPVPLVIVTLYSLILIPLFLFLSQNSDNHIK